MPVYKTIPFAKTDITEARYLYCLRALKSIPFDSAFIGWVSSSLPMLWSFCFGQRVSYLGQSHLDFLSANLRHALRA
jgi:hypothetical protein